MSKILVTGGAGFIGSNLCERLVQEGHVVTSLDNYFTGSTSNHVDGVRYIRSCTSEINNISDLPKPDLVYHLGEYSRVEQSFEDIELVWNYNKTGTFQVLQYCRAVNAKLVYAGSSTKFADITDDYVQSPYAWSKMTNTELVKNYGLWYGLDYAITYFYNSYGKREISEGKYATLIAKYTQQMHDDQKLEVVSPGVQQRNFTHVDDIVDALILIGQKGSGDGYGIGSDDAYSILDVARLFGGPIDLLEPRRGNRMSASVITTKTKELGWKPKRNLVDYIEQLRNNNWNLLK
jgi:UDP-glucose 4-epimerase